MTLLEKYERYTQLWRVALPHIAEPGIQDVARWSDYPPEIVERAILRTARRFAPEKLSTTFEPTEAHKYVSAVSKGETERKHATMTVIKITTPDPASQLDAAQAAAPNHYRDLAEELLRSGEVTDTTTIGDAKRIAERYNVVRQ